MQHISIDEGNKNIESALESWDFDKAYKLYQDNITQDSNDLKMDFCVFLHDIGKLDELLQFIQTDSKDNSDTLQCPQFWDNAKLNWGGGGITLIQTHIETNTATLYENFQLKQKVNPNFLLNRFIADDALTADIAFYIMQNYMKDIDNKIIQNYFLKNTLQYFYNTDTAKQQDFFIPAIPSSFIIFLKLINEEKSIGAAQYYKECIEHYRNILLQQCKDLSHLIPQITAKPHTEYKRFAICLYGILRGDYKATLEDIITNLAIPLNADVFLFTWDTYQVWPGLCGWGNWVLRMLNPTLYEVVPFEVSYRSHFPKLLPNVFQKINSEYNVALDTNDIKDLQNKYPCLKHYEIINQEQTQYEGKELGGGYHLYYGIHRVIEVMKQYEISHNVAYDFIFTLRSDGDMQYNQGNREQILQDLQTCESNEIFDTLTDDGNNNITIYGPRDVMLALGSLYHFIKALQIESYKGIRYNNHNMSFLYLTMCGVIKNKTALIDQRYGLGNKSQKGMLFPDIQQELLLDIETLQQTHAINAIKLQSVVEAFEILKKVYPNTHLNKDVITQKINHMDPIREIGLQKAGYSWYVSEEESRYIPPQDIKPLFKVIKFIGKYFPNAKVRRQARRFTDFFNFLYKKVYGKNL